MLDVVMNLDAYRVFDVGSTVLWKFITVDDSDVRVVYMFCQPVGVCQHFGTSVSLSRHVRASGDGDSSSGGSIAQEPNDATNLDFWRVSVRLTMLNPLAKLAQSGFKEDQLCLAHLRRAGHYPENHGTIEFVSPVET